MELISLEEVLLMLVMTTSTTPPSHFAYEYCIVFRPIWVDADTLLHWEKNTLHERVVLLLLHSLP